MGSYDTIQVPVSGQPVSKSQYGDRVRAAIIDLDRRMSAYDASTGIGKAFQSTSPTLGNTNETIILTIQDFIFRAGYAYRANFRTGFSTATDGTLLNVRLRKGDTLTLSGSPLTATNADYGEYYRYRGCGSPVVSALGSIYLIRSAGTDLTTDVSLTGQASVGGAGTVQLYSTSSTPKFFVIEPCGFATDYTGMGVDVT